MSLGRKTDKNMLWHANVRCLSLVAPIGTFSPSVCSMALSPLVFFPHSIVGVLLLLFSIHAMTGKIEPRFWLKEHTLWLVYSIVVFIVLFIRMGPLLL